jgi:predicted nucleic acid-binding protein
VICLDNNAAISAFQKNPPPNIAIHRDRVRHFIQDQSEQRLMFPTVALAEYLWKAVRDDLEKEILRVVGTRMVLHSFDEMTAEIAAKLGRQYAAGKSLGAVAKETGHDRIALKADLLIVATALQHAAQFFLTGDSNCHALATFAGLNGILISTLPDPPPPPPPLPPRPPRGTPPATGGTLFDMIDND